MNRTPQPFDLTSQAFNADPFPTFARMREAGPLVWTKLPFLGQAWVVPGYAACNEVLRDPELFTRDVKKGGAKYPAWLTWLMPGMFRTLMSNMLAHDEPDHRRLRSLVEEAFVRRNVQQMHGRIETLADGLLDDLDRKMAAEGRVDLLQDYARTLPLAVICELLGLPEADRPKFTEWAKGLATVKSAWQFVGAVSGMRKLLRYLKEEVRQRRQSPREGLVSELVAVGSDQDRLGDDELLSMLFLLLLAGHETTTHLVSGGVWALLNHPEQKAELLADWSRADTAVDEILRYHGPVQFSKPRFVVRDTQFHGVDLKRGEYVLPVLAAANTDPARFADPERFDVRRHPNPHLAFGTGIHTCLGLKLARAEAGIAFRRLFTRFPDLRVELPPDEPAWVGRFGTRALRRLPVTW